MLEYLEALMSREPVLEDWEIMESARYAFKYVQLRLEVISSLTKCFIW